MFRTVFIPKTLKPRLYDFLKNKKYKLESSTFGLRENTKFAGYISLTEKTIELACRKTGYLNIIADDESNVIGTLYVDHNHTCLKVIF